MGKDIPERICVDRSTLECVYYIESLEDCHISTNAFDGCCIYTNLSEVWRNVKETPFRMAGTIRESVLCVDNNNRAFTLKLHDDDCFSIMQFWREVVEKYNIRYWSYLRDILPYRVRCRL